MSLKISEFPYTTNYLDYIINGLLPDGGGGFINYNIYYADLLADVLSRIIAAEGDISTLQSDVTALENLVISKERKVLTASTTFTLPADSKLMASDFVWNSGTLTVKVGTTAGGDEIMRDRTLNSTTTSIMNRTVYYTISSDIIYITITGTGSIDGIFTYYQNLNT